MQTLPLTHGPVAFEGAVSLEVTPTSVKPWRLRFEEISLFESALLPRAESPSGVRMTFMSDTDRVVVEADAIEHWEQQWKWDLLVDGVLHSRVVQSCRQGRVEFAPLSAGKNVSRGKLRRIEIYMPPQYLPVSVRSVEIDEAAKAQPWKDVRPRWVVYGSSITHAKEAAGPSETWPAIVAREFDLHLTNLGYGGQEHLEPMVAEMIRDLPADLISLCVGGNAWYPPTLSERTFRAAVIGLVRTIRQKHPRTPLVVCSFISTLHDGQANSQGKSTEDYRTYTREGVEALQRYGDASLFYVDGKEIYGPSLRHLMADGVHPGAEGQHELARNYIQLVMPRLIPPATARV